MNKIIKIETAARRITIKLDESGIVRSVRVISKRDGPAIEEISVLFSKNMVKCDMADLLTTGRGIWIA